MVNWNPGKRGGGDTKISKEIITKIVSKFDENYNLTAPCEARQTLKYLIKSNLYTLQKIKL